MELLGPTGVVPGEQVVTLQCICRDADTFIHHAVFTNGETQECGDDSYLVVFCDTAKFETEPTFVGVVAGGAQKHGAHRHVTVAVSGAVTLAAVLTDVTGFRAMDSLGFTAEQNTQRIAGGPGHVLTLCRSDSTDVTCVGHIGTLLQLGRQPSNEIHVLLTPSTLYSTDKDDRARRANRVRGDDFDQMTVGDIQHVYSRIVKGDDTDIQAMFTAIKEKPAAAAANSMLEP